MHPKIEYDDFEVEVRGVSGPAEIQGVRGLVVSSRRGGSRR